MSLKEMGAELAGWRIEICLAYRRCELVRVNGTEVDVQFLKTASNKKKPGGASKHDAHTGAPECIPPV
jgi:hypothetical protein